MGTIDQDFDVLGIVGYNNYLFGPSLYATQRAEPQYDKSGRTIIYYVVTFHFEWVVQVSNQAAQDINDVTTTTDQQLETIRGQLMHNGGTFNYAGNGYGYLGVNPGPNTAPLPNASTTPQFDPVWGPKPRNFTVRPLAGKAAFCTIDIDVALMNCPDILASGILMEFTYTLNWTVTDGYTRRVYAAHLSIPMPRNRNKPRTLPDNADKYLERAMPTLLFGFVRRPIERTLSLDKAQLDVRVVDEQHPSRNFPPPLCIKPQFRHHVETDTGMVAWSGRFDGTYEYELNTSAGEAFKAFIGCIVDRLDNTKKYAAVVNGVASVPIIMRVALDELDAYDRNRSHFEVDYTYTVDLATLTKSILPATGLFRPLPGSDYNVWAGSMKKCGAWSPRGYAALYQRDEDDLILDMCYSTTTPTTPTGQGSTPGGGRGSNDGLKGPLDPLVPKLTPKTSFMDYHLELMVLPKHSTVELKPLPKNPVNYSPANVSVDSADGYRTPYRGSNPSVVQMRNIPSYTVILRGRALRAGYSITPPEIKVLAGQAAIPAPGNLDYYRTETISNQFVPVIFAEWQRAYILPDNPQQPIGAPINPMWGGPGGATSGGGGGGHGQRA